MRCSGLKLQFSLRSLFLATVMTALLLQSRLSVLQSQREQRREVFVTDVREQVIAAERIEPEFSRRMLAFVERRITTSTDAVLLSSAEQNQLLHIVQAARSRLPTALHPDVQANPATPAIDQWAWSDAAACPW